MRLKCIQMFKNQKGMSTIVIVFGIAMVILVALGTAQMYVTSRARVHARIRLAYKYTFIMEDAAKMIVNARLAWLATAGVCPAPSVARILPGGKQICLGNTAGDRCIRDTLGRDACVCMTGQTDTQCANSANASLDKDFSNIARVEAIPSRFQKIQTWLRDRQLESEDVVASAIDRILKKPQHHFPDLYRQLFLEKATAATVGVLTLRAMGSNAGNYNPTASSVIQADTMFDCVTECITIRVCVPNTFEPLAMPQGLNELCVSQIIGRGKDNTVF